VDASTKESLKRIDRPLFKDFWQRFLDSLKALSEKVPGYEYFLFPLLSHVTFSAKSRMAKGGLQSGPWMCWEHVIYLMYKTHKNSASSISFL